MAGDFQQRCSLINCCFSLFTQTWKNNRKHCLHFYIRGEWLNGDMTLFKSVCLFEYQLFSCFLLLAERWMSYSKSPFNFRLMKNENQLSTQYKVCQTQIHLMFELSRHLKYIQSRVLFQYYIHCTGIKLIKFMETDWINVTALKNLHFFLLNCRQKKKNHPNETFSFLLQWT